MSTFVATGLTLDQDTSVSAGVIVVPHLGGPAGLVSTEPMIFRADGAGSTGKPIQLCVQTNPALVSAVVAPTTVRQLSTALGVDVLARSLTKGERLQRYGKAEVLLAVIAVLLAISAIVSATVTPSIDKSAGRADLAMTLAPIQQSLADAVRSNNLAAVAQSEAQLRLTLKAHDHANDDASSAVTITTLLLGVMSAVIAFGVAVKRARKGS